MQHTAVIHDAYSVCCTLCIVLVRQIWQKLFEWVQGEAASFLSGI